jgi:hypothetical protein
MSSEAGSHLTSDPLTVSELEHIYHELVSKQDFYSDSYGCEWTPEPYEDIGLGQYLFSRSRNARPSGTKRPAWLYRSYPAGELEL